MTSFQDGAGGNELADVETAQAVHAATLQLRRDFVPCLADFLDLFCNQHRQLVLRPDQVKQPLTQAQGHKILGAIALLSQCTRASKGLTYFDRRIALGDSERRSERDLELQLLLPAPIAVLNAGEH